MKVLLITEYYREGNPSFGLSNTYHNYEGSLSVIPAIDLHVVHYDTGGSDKDIICRCISTLDRPDVIIYTETSHSNANPDYITLACIRRTFGIPIVMLWTDSDGDDVRRMDMVYPFVDRHVLFDHFDVNSQTRHPERYMHSWCPQDPRVVFSDNRERDIPVSFVGSRANDGNRIFYIDILEKAGIPVFVRGGRGEDNIPTDEYFDIYRRSKVTLNFSRPGALKGRLLEGAMCGALVMEPHHTLHRLYFRDFVDIIPYSNDVELVERVRYFLDHEDERIRIAANGYKRAMEYNSEKLWRNVLGSVGLEI